MEINTATIGDLVKMGSILWAKGYDSVPKTMRNSGIFKVVSIGQGTGNTRDFSEIDVEEYAKRKDEGDEAQRANIQQGYSKTMTQYRVALDVGITYEMRTQNKYPEVVAKLTGLGRQVANRQELDLAHRIGFGASTTYTDMDGTTVDITTGDGLQLFYSAHTIKTAVDTYRNILANNPRLSKGALEAMERLVVEDTINQFGEKMVMSFDILFTTDDPNTVNTAREYLQSTADVEGSNSGVKNVYMSKYRHVVLPLIATTAAGLVDTDKRYYWGIASSQASQAYLGIWEEAHIKPPQEDDFSTDDTIFGARGGYGIAITNGSFVKLSKGDASA